VTIDNRKKDMTTYQNLRRKTARKYWGLSPSLGIILFAPRFYVGCSYSIANKGRANNKQAQGTGRKAQGEEHRA